MGIFGSKSVVWVPENEKLKEKIGEVLLPPRPPTLVAPWGEAPLPG